MWNLRRWGEGRSGQKMMWVNSNREQSALRIHGFCIHRFNQMQIF